MREVGGAAALGLGSVALALCTAIVGLQLDEDLAVLGAAATLAWLIDGTALRYIGAGTVALAIGGGMTLGQRLNVPGYQEVVVFGFMGLALLLISLVNPKAVGGSAGLLVLISLTVIALDYGGPYNAGWELTAILGLWSVLQLVRILRTARRRPEGA